MDIFKYERPELPKDCIFSISPSQIGKFFSLPRIWYEEQVLGGEKYFQGNTGSVMGSICHYIYKSVALRQEVTREDINKQLLQYTALKPELELDVNDIMINYPLITSEVVNSYIIPSMSRGVSRVEEQVVAKVMDGIYISGTYDRMEGDCLVDYKNVNIKPNEAVIPFDYKIQLLSYVYALRQKGHELNRIRLVYGVKPTKTIPARCIVVTEQVDYVADKLISDTLQLIGETVLMARNNPSLTHLLFKSMDLKQ